MILKESNDRRAQAQTFELAHNITNWDPFYPVVWLSEEEIGVIAANYCTSS